MGLTSRIPAVIDGVVAAMRSLPGYRDPEATTTGVPVYDGPMVGVSGDRESTWVCIGWSGTPDTEETSGTAQQTIATLGNRIREETGQITVRVVSQSGDTDSKGRRDAAFTVLGDLEDAVRDDPRLALDPTWMREIHMSGEIQVNQYFGAGPVCEITTSLGYRARI